MQISCSLLHHQITTLQTFILMMHCRHYEVMEQTTMPSVVQECLQLLQSEAMFLILSNLTGLRLHELAPNSDFEEDAEAGDGDAPGISKPKRPRLSSTDAANSHSDTCGG